MAFSAEILPSRKVTALVIVPGISLVVWFGISAWQSRTTIEQETSRDSDLNSVLAQKQREYNLRDTDGDGLKDWEEFIAGTDFERRDTDGDGMSDYAESIRSNRDPLDPNDPEPVMATSSDATSTPFYLDDPSLTDTEVFARDIFATFVQLQQADAFNTNIQDTLINSVGQDVVSRDKRQAAYSIEALRIMNDPTRNQIKNFGDQYFAAADLLDPVTRNGLAVLSDLTETENPVYIDELDSHIRAYTNYQQELASLAVPRVIADIYLELLNNLEFYIETQRVMKNAVEDPFGALLAGRRFIEDERLLGISFDAMRLYLDNK